MNNATNKAGNVKLWDLSADQRKVLESACDKAGAANWLWPSAVESLAGAGLVEPLGNHAVRATEKGRDVWFMR